MKRWLILGLLAMLFAGRPSRAEDLLPVTSEPIPATAVYLRSSGAGAYQQVADRTPVTLKVKIGTYDVMVEAHCAFFLRYHGEQFQVPSGFQVVHVVMKPQLDPARLGGFLLLVGLAGAGWAAWRFRQQPVRRHSVLVVDPGSGVRAPITLPSPVGKKVTTQSGRRYMILRQVGVGAWGVVYEARQVDVDVAPREAIKILHVEDDDERKRFAREFEICSHISHPGIVGASDWGEYRQEDSAWPFMVMELISGRELRDVMNERRQLPIAQTVAWGVEILDALRAAHAAGVVHRDLKPENIMITTESRVKITDFGIARRLGESRLTRTGGVLGTPLYMAPEQMEGEASASSDLYSTGILLWEMLAGRPPLADQELWAMLYKKSSKPIQPPSSARADVSPALDAVIMKLISHTPEARYGDAGTAMRALQVLLPDLPTDAHTSPPSGFSEPRQIGPYRVLEAIGSGGTGKVYRAEAPTGQSCAVKVLQLEAHPQAWQRFEREVAIGLELVHPHVCRFLDADLAARPNPYLVMEYLDGETLAAFLNRQGKIGAEQARPILSQLLDGLGAVHSLGIVHRDMKPANVMLLQDGSVKLMDFGLALKSGNPTLTVTGESMGTPGYLSPEQILDVHRVDARADLFNVGLIAYRMLAGRMPFNASSLELMLLQVVQATFTPLQEACPLGISDELAAWVHRLLARRPEDRFATAQEAREALS
ncbi:MAG: serine/threonine-protein kinase [Candidatus Xenobia bacterium]